MPLLDHFRPPLSTIRPWSGFHRTWASKITEQLNLGGLPPEYVAMPQITFGGQIEEDAHNFQDASPSHVVNGGTATATWAPPRPLLTAPLDVLLPESCEVHVYQELGGLELRVAIELVSPTNNDRPATRLAFAIKCAAYLQRNIALVIVDVVTERQANLHAELVDLLRLPADFSWRSPTNLSAIAYRTHATKEQNRILAWPESLQVGAPLPTMPLWLSEELCLPLALEDSYLATCTSLRIPAP